jgi:MAF protein
VHDRTILVLASSSPRRKQLFELGNWEYSIIVPDVDETQRAGENPDQYVLRLSREKACAAVRGLEPGSIVVAADTAVIDGFEILGKPRDARDAERILKQLRGRVHQVYTGLAIMRAGDEKVFTELCVTDVPMRDYSDDEMASYIQSGDPMDKAGAYAIQHPGFHPVESLHGCRASVMGLPMCHVVRMLQKFDITPDLNVPMACQSLLNYECPISDAILRGEMVG